MHDSPRWIPVAEQAKLIRAALKKAFPGVKFSVRSRSYAGGASIDVRWTDGPQAKAVDAVVGIYAGGDFDGMIDLAYSHEHWLMPDGSVAIASSPGTEGSRGVHERIPEQPAPVLGAVRVRFAAKYVSTHRDMSRERAEAIATALAERWKLPVDVKPCGLAGEGFAYLEPADVPLWRKVANVNDPWRLVTVEARELEAALFPA